MRDQLRRYFDERHVRLKRTWFEAVMSYLAQALPHNDIRANTEKYAQLVYDQLLYSDLAESMEPTQEFPINSKRLVIAQNGLLQVNHVLDISTPAYAQYRARINAIDDSDLPEEDDDAVKGFASKRPNKGAKLHLLELTDGRSVVKALFLDAEMNVRAATLAPGTKIMLVDKATYRSGYLQLTAANAQILGGDVEKLLSKNTPLKVLARLLKINDDLAQKHLAQAKNLRQLLSETSDPSKVVAQEAVRETRNSTGRSSTATFGSLNYSDVGIVSMATTDCRSDSGFSAAGMNSCTTGRRSEDSFFDDLSRWSPIPSPESLPPPKDSTFDVNCVETIIEVKSEINGALARRHSSLATKSVFPKVFEESHRGQQNQKSTRNSAETTINSVWLDQSRLPQQQKKDSLNQSVLAGMDTDSTPRPAHPSKRKLLGPSFDSEFTRPALAPEEPHLSTINRSGVQTTSNPQPRRSLHSDANKVDTYKVCGSTSSVAQLPSSPMVTATTVVRPVASVQPHRSPQTLSIAKRPQQDCRGHIGDDHSSSFSGSPIVPFKRPAPSARLNEGCANDTPSAQLRRSGSIAAAHRNSDIFPKANRDLGNEPLVEKYRSLGIHPIAEVIRKKRYLMLSATRRIQPLHCEAAKRFDPEGERWTLKALVADESTDAPVLMVVSHELIMRVFRYTVAECKVFRETNDSEKIEECKRNFCRLRDTLSRSDIVLEVELSSDPAAIPLVKDATGISELLGIV